MKNTFISVLLMAALLLPAYTYAQVFNLNQIASTTQTSPYFGVIMGDGVGAHKATASSSPTVGYITSTSTFATSTFAGGISVNGGILMTNFAGAGTLCLHSVSGVLALSSADCGTGSGSSLNTNPLSVGYLVSSSTATSTYSGGIEVNGVGAPWFSATSSTATSTFTNFQVNNFNQRGSATSTHATGITIAAGCFAISNNCIGLANLSGQVTLTTQVTGILPVANGGTGVATLQGGQLIYGNATGIVGTVATGTVSGANGITVTAGRSAVGGALAIDCTVGSAASAGCIQSADWSLFNNKMSSSSLTAIFPFTPTTWGNSTSTTIGFLNGILVNAASSTVVGNILITGNSTTSQATTTIFSSTLASTTNLVVSAAGGTAGCATFSATGLISNTGSACSSGGASPGGSGTEIQYRAGASTFGALTPSSYILAANRASFGTTTTQLGVFTLGSSTEPQLILSDNIPGDPTWYMRTISGALYVGTSTNATTTQPYLVVTKNGDSTFEGSVNASGFTSSNARNISLTTPGRLTINVGASNGTASSPDISWLTSGVPLGGFFNPTANAIAMAAGSPISEVWRSTDSTHSGYATTSPFGVLSIHANAVDTNKTLFVVGSSTATATTTLFSISNTGLASTTGLVISNTAGSGTRCLQVDANGVVSANAAACTTGSFSWPFTTTTYGALTAQATTTMMIFSSFSAASTTLGNAEIGNLTATSSIKVPLTGLLQGNGVASNVTAITNSSTAGQVLRVTGASTYAWGALDLANSSAVTGTLAVGNGGTGSTNLSVSNLLASNASGNVIGTSTIAFQSFFGTSTTATSTLLAPLLIATTSQTAFQINDGFGTALLRMNTASTTGPLFAIFATTSAASACGGAGKTCLFSIDQYGHLAASSTAPTLTSCGTSPSLSSDSSDAWGTITVGSVAATSCTLTFGSAHTIGTHCIIGNQTVSVVNAGTYTESLTGFVYSQTGLTSDKLDYACFGQ